ncbi:MAG: hypothetical protein IJX28_07295 [Clostridia bacterium]|nr:hypothetical protein [Clostridia bacterium]
MKQSNKKSPVFFYIAIFLLICLVLANSSLTKNLYARFRTGDSVQDSARVAKFDIREDFSGLSMHLNVSVRPGKPYTYTFHVENHSEVEVEYEVSVMRITANLPLVFEVTSEDGTPQIGIGQTETITLTVKWEEANTSPEFAGMVDLIRLDLTVAQTD